MKKFIYLENVNNYIDSSKDVFLASISPIMNNKEEILLELYKKLKFPNYFGFNWDALSDCLRDLQWIKEKRVLIVHEDLPNLSDKELFLYIDVLQYCMEDWEIYKGPYEKHDLDVVFPLKAKQRIETL
jgi:RNAse (barnase) inhibitor barstar